MDENRFPSIGTFGLAVTSLMVLVKVFPVVPGHFSRYHWMALAIWGVLGALIRVPSNRKISEYKIEVPDVAP